MNYPTEYGANQTPIYATEPVRIGKHEWVCFVYQSGSDRFTQYCWRKHYWDDTEWEPMENWPTYNHNDGTYAGCPKSLRTRVWEPNADAIRAALRGEVAA